MQSVPKNWPSHVVYLKRQEWPTAAIPNFYCKTLADPQQTVPVLPDVEPCIGICKKVTIKPITDPSHPACGSWGLFAAQTLNGPSYLLDYKGVILPEEQESKTSDYSLHFNELFSIDAEKKGNEARFLNDYRGIGEKPMVKFELYRCKSGTVRMGIFVLPRVTIKKGQEILINYGKGFWKERGLLDSRA
ncbi:hypothetical protein HDV03_000150 [Kappamyces sp. JEL0829]|nr:hypothetical protein HDV03_000150 [Kappamyces sp. JEL0829]